MCLAASTGSLLLALLAAAPSGTTSAEEAIRPLLPELAAWRRDFHQHPELGNREVRTAKRLAELLRGFGLEVRTGIAHTGLTARLEGGQPGPTLAVRADIDALPVTEELQLPFSSHARGEYQGRPVGLMHACGHDAHMAILLGVAKALSRQRATLPGQVLFIFQPAEEGAPAGEEGGAPLMAKEGVFRPLRPDALFGLHVVSFLPVGTVALRPGGIMASSDTFRIVVGGVGSHGATPWKGVDPIVTAAEIVTAAQTIVSRKLDINRDPAVVTFGIFNAGQRFNIVPERAELEGTVRAFNEEMRDQALEALRQVASHVAAAHGASVKSEIPMPGSNPVNHNDPALTAKVRASLERALGREQVREATRWTAAEDFPLLALAAGAPSVYFFVGATAPGQDPATAPTNHSPRFLIDERALAVGAAGLLQACLDFLHRR